jgi:3-oxoacyl-[acyl-carrier-protein] synthase-1
VRHARSFEVLDRRAMRFHGGGSAWNHIAMEQAIRDAGLEEKDISQRAHRHRHGLGRPFDPHAEDADITREKGSQAVGPFAVPKAMSSTASATLATWFKIKGVNYSISSACATSNHCIGNAYELIQWGKQDVIFAGGCEELDWTLSCCSTRWARCPPTSTRRLLSPRAPMTRSATASSSPAAPACSCWRNWSTPRPAAPASMARSSAMARPRTATTWSPLGRGRGALHAHGADGVKAKIDYINPHATSTPVGDAKEIEAIREVFGAGEKSPPISATKSLTGHSLGATGVQEAIYSLLMMQQRLHLRERPYRGARPGFADMPIVRKRIDNAGLGCVLSNSFGFGGTNATIVMKRLEA